MCNSFKRKHPLISHKTQVHLYVQYYTLKSNAYLRSFICAKISITCPWGVAAVYLTEDITPMLLSQRNSFVIRIITN